MNRFRRKSLLALAILVFAPQSIGAEPVDIADALRSATNTAELDLAVGEFERSRLQLAEKLGSLLADAKTAERKARYCFVLGEMGLGTAAEVLAANLMVEVATPMEYTRIPLWGKHPCQEALAKLGPQARGVTIRLLSKPGSAKLRSAALRVLQVAEGSKGAVRVLGGALEGASPEQRRGLEEALALARLEAGS